MNNKLINWRTLLFTLGGLVVNIVLSRFILLLDIPIFLDSVGTILTGALCGILPGMIVGFVSNALNSISDPVTLYYGILSILFAILSSRISRRGWFKKPLLTLAAVPLFSLIGGALGSLITWALYGFDFGTGISAPFSIMLYENFGMNKFIAQFTADFAIDLIDKFITLAIVFAIIWLLPKKFLLRFPYGCFNIRSDDYSLSNYDLFGIDESIRLKGDNRNKFKSLSIKIANMIAITAGILSIFAVAISFMLHSDMANERYFSLCSSSVNMMLSVLDGEAIGRYGRTGETDEAYDEMKAELVRIKDSIEDIEFMYVYRIDEEGCHVIFDLDTEEVEASSFGDVIPFDDSFASQQSALLAGKEIDPIITNDTYGWLMTVYKPIKDSTGKCVAYAAADIEMENVVSDRAVFTIRIISVLFGVSIIIVYVMIAIAHKKMVTPLNKLTVETSEIAYGGRDKLRENADALLALNIKTADEIESLFYAVSTMTETLTDNIAQLAQNSREISEKAAFIAKLQDNIIYSFADMVENRDENTGNHIKRTSDYVRLICKLLKERGYYSDQLTDEQITNISKSAPLHDIGKIKISDMILNKPGRLDPAEYEIMKTHTIEGRNILKGVLSNIEGEGYLNVAIEMASYHHERYDGNGYPYGLKGTDIPLCARIMSVADVFDALISTRSYKGPFSFNKSMEIIKSEAGNQFDPLIAEVFTEATDEVLALTISK